MDHLTKTIASHTGYDRGDHRTCECGWESKPWPEIDPRTDHAEHLADAIRTLNGAL
jgi:hypothetical protein